MRWSHLFLLLAVFNAQNAITDFARGYPLMGVICLVCGILMICCYVRAYHQEAPHQASQ